MTPRRRAAGTGALAVTIGAALMFGGVGIASADPSSDDPACNALVYAASYAPDPGAYEMVRNLLKEPCPQYSLPPYSHP
jgi:hypothetical protein